MAVAGVVGAAAIAASAEQRASNSEQQLQVAQDELADSRELTGDFATALVQERELSRTSFRGSSRKVRSC